jgi:transcription antitermination factor NusG
MSIFWYALKSKPRKEDALWRQAKAEGYEIYYPRLRVNPVNPRARKLIPYFPSYLFVHIDIEHVGQSVFEWMPYSSGLVSFGGEPSVVPDHLISTLQKKIEEINKSGGETFHELKHGDLVLIQNGPFRGLEAIFDTRLSGDERVRVLLELIASNRQVPLELHVGQIVRKR